MIRRLGYAIWVAMGVVLPRTGLTESRDADVLICSDDVRAAGPLPELLDNDIQALGYEAEVDEGCDIDTDAAAKETIIDRDVQALVLIDTRQQTARIWVWDRGKGQRVTRSLPLLDDTVENNASETSLGISELLRAIFVELKTLPKSMTQGPSAVSPAAAPPVALSSPVEPAKTARNAAETGAPIDVPEQTPNVGASLEAVSVDSTPAKPMTSPPRRPWRLDIRTAVTALTFQEAPTAQMGLGGVFSFERRFGVEVLALIPIYPLNLDSREGTVVIRNGDLNVGIRLATLKGVGRVRAAAGLGVGLDVTVVKGDAASTLRGYTKTTFAALPYGRVEMDIVLSRHVSFAVEVLIGSSVPRTRVLVMDKPVLKVAPLFLSGLAGINVAL